jgi:hypothetical protein
MNATETAIERDIHNVSERGEDRQETGRMMGADEILLLQEVDMLTSEPQLRKTFNGITPKKDRKLERQNLEPDWKCRKNN